MNKKGFVLIETLVVIMFVLLTFSILYSNAVPLLGKYKEISHYNGIDTTYDLYHVKKFLVKDPKYNSIFDSGHKIITCNNQTIYNQTACNMLLSNLGIDEVNDELIFLKADAKEELLNDNNISEEVKDYIKSLELVSDILILQNDGYISYVDLDLASSSPRDPILPNIPDDDYPEESLREKLLQKISNSTCNPIIEDYNSTTNTTIKYLSGSSDCIDFNYVWYSGKLWQITSINQDGTMKMIMASGIAIFNYTTESSIYASSTEVYQWLNEDFKDTLYNYQNIIVQNVNWNTTSNLIEACKNDLYDFEDENGPECYIPKNPDSVAKPTKVVGDVGLLNAYEDYQAYKNLIVDDNYSDYNDFDSDSFLHTSINNSATLTINKIIGYAGDGQFETKNVVYRMGRGSIGIDQSFILRPVVVLKADILTDGGNGTIDSPFRLKDDKEKAISNTTSLNSRLNGEYVLFAGETYRILGFENNAIKLLKNESLEMEKFFANDCQYGTMFPTTDYWDYYLNNTWYNSIEERYQKMMVQGVYYLGAYNFKNYKSTICQKVDSKTTKTCTKITATWTGYVGLPRIGETIFMTDDDDEKDYNTAFISPYDNNNLELFGSELLIRSIDKDYYSRVSVRPVITLSPDVVITTGNGRSPETAFRIALKS